MDFNQLIARIGDMILDRLLSCLTVTVAPLALCEIAKGWRLRLPAPAETLLHFVLSGSGRIVQSPLSTSALQPGYLAIIPAGCYNMLEAGDPVVEELFVNEVPFEPGVHKANAPYKTVQNRTNPANPAAWPGRSIVDHRQRCIPIT